MDEITLRLPTETTASLRAEADERGVDIDEHIRDIIDAYRASDERRPGAGVEYMHAIGNGSVTVSNDDSETESEEIGSFTYGSRSIISR